MGVSRGKQFEKVVESCLKRVKDVSVDRVHDQTTHYKGSTNICDYIVYKKPYEYYFECKTTYGKTWPIKNMTDGQYYGMLEKSRIKGVCAGLIIWFIDYDTTMFVPIQLTKQLKEQGFKSIRYDFKHIDRILLCGEKKRTFFTYYMSDFLTELERRFPVNEIQSKRQ